MNEKYPNHEQGLSETERNLAELKELFKDSLDNVFVRGSLVRGDKPYGDVDLNIYNSGGIIITPEFPKVFHGIRMSYRAVPLEHLDEYFDVCLRGTSTLTETVELHCADPKVPEIFARQREKLVRERLEPYLEYLQLEEQLMRQLSGTRDINKTADRKEFPGGKRTLSRIVWSLKALNPDLYGTNNTEELITIFQVRGIMSPDFADKFKKAFFASSEEVAQDDFLSTAQEITDWFDHQLTPMVNKRLAEKMSGDLISMSDQAIIFTTSSERLEQIFAAAERLDVEHQKWLVLWALSVNVNSPKNVLVGIYNKYKFKHAYKHVVRNLFGNHSFPIAEVDLEGLSFDSIALETYQQRAARYKELQTNKG